MAAAEHLLGYRMKSVLDVGCGEGPWRAHLKKLRPGVRYAGMDSSAYAVKRYGRTRDIRLGTVGALGEAGFTPVGLHLYATRDVARTLVALETPAARSRTR